MFPRERFERRETRTNLPFFFILSIGASTKVQFFFSIPSGVIHELVLLLFYNINKASRPCLDHNINNDDDDDDDDSVYNKIQKYNIS